MTSNTQKLFRLRSSIAGVHHKDIRSFVAQVAATLRNRASEYLRELSWDALEGSGDVELLETALGPLKVGGMKPHRVFYNMNLAGVDSSSFALRAHPMRVIIARSGIYARSLRGSKRISFKGPYRYSFTIVDRVDDLDFEDSIRIAEVRLMAELEAISAISFIDENADVGVDLIFFDGPMVHPKTADIDVELVQELKDAGVPSVFIVKNSSSRKFAKLLGAEHFFDSDVLSVLLPPSHRTPVFMTDSVTTAEGYTILPPSIRILSFYYMSPKGMLFRFDVPYWVAEQYGLDTVIRWCVAEIYAGGGDKSLMISVAENVSKFTRSEREYMRSQLEATLMRSGIFSPASFNQRRWGAYR